MAKENHFIPNKFTSSVIERLAGWQRKLRVVTGLVPSRKLPLLTPAEAFGPDVERFRDAAQALVPWRDKQSQSWRFMGQLKTAKGRSFGFQLSFQDRHTQNDFFGAIPTRWLTPRSFASHFVITDPMNAESDKTFRFWQRGGLFSNEQGFAADDRFHVGIEGWHSYRREDGIIVLDAAASGDSLHLELQPLKPLAYHGQSGYAQRDGNPENAAFYCSYTRMQASGWLLIDGRLEDVSGHAWMDHEKFTQKAAAQDDTQDIISLQFSSGEELMLSFVNSKEGEMNRFSSGSWIDKQGTIKHLIREDLKTENLEHWISPKTGARYPIKRHIAIETLGLDLLLRAPLPNQEVDATRTNIVSTWQGMVSAQARLKENEVEATGFMLLHGYDRRPRAKVLEFLVNS
jgi:predicted secreted hydrolase